MKQVFHRLWICLAVALAVTVCASTTVWADGPRLTCKRAVIMDQDGRIVFSKNGEQTCSQASLTKLMTIYLAYERKIPKNRKIKITRRAYNAGIQNSRTRTGGRVGDRYRCGELIRAAAVASSNDAAEALGAYMGKSRAKFARMMTKKAAKLGMKKTRYKNASGLSAKGHYTTAKDQAVLLRALHKKYGARFTKDSCRASTALHNLTNSKRNRRLITSWYKTSLVPIRSMAGAKTGTTDAAGNCMASIYKTNGKTYYIINLGSTSDTTRFSDARALMAYADKLSH